MVKTREYRPKRAMIGGGSFDRGLYAGAGIGGILRGAASNVAGFIQILHSPLFYPLYPAIRGCIL